MGQHCGSMFLRAGAFDWRQITRDANVSAVRSSYRCAGVVYALTGQCRSNSEAPHAGRRPGSPRMSMILVVNAGSSSIKFRVLDMPGERRLAWGLVEGIGGAQADLHFAAEGREPVRRAVAAADHAAAADALLGQLAAMPAGGGIHAVGHRVVHGGVEFSAPLPIDARAIARIEAVSALAPLHNAAGLACIRLIRTRFPDLPQVAVFDTAFHHDLPECARLYALPLALQRAQGIRRFGFHGLSHRAVARAAAAWLQRPPEDLRMITLHLGNGASACAVRGGRSVDTSMGFTPLEGLIMGSRCGDLDPSLPGHLAAALGWDAARVDTVLNHESGLRGLCGDSDMRRVEARRAAGDADAHRAFELFCYRIRKYVGAYHAVLNGLDALVFTAGIGEHSAAVRAAVCADLDALGIAVDARRNTAVDGGITDIGQPHAAVRVLVVPTDEETEIARATHACLYGDA